MNPTEKNRVLDLFNVLRHAGQEESLRYFAGQDMIAQARDHHINFAAMAALRSYARCRAWFLYYKRTGQPHKARREAALAGHQTRALRSL